MTATTQVFTAATLALLKTAIDAGTYTTGALTQVLYTVLVKPDGVEYSALVFTFSA